MGIKVGHSEEGEESPSSEIPSGAGVGIGASGPELNPRKPNKRSVHSLGENIQNEGDAVEESVSEKSTLAGQRL
jgi:hypothetical protein